MVSPTHNQVASPPTYGEMLTVAADHVRDACRTGVGPFADAEQAADAVTDYERLLAVSGRHLQLLLTPVGTATTVRPRVAHDPTLYPVAAALAALDVTRAGDNPWAGAGDRLGAAHDLLATHLGPTGQLRTPDASLLADPALREQAAARVVALAREPLAVTNTLLSAARAAQPASPIAPPLTRATYTHVRQATARSPAMPAYRISCEPVSRKQIHSRATEVAR